MSLNCNNNSQLIQIDLQNNYNLEGLSCSNIQQLTMLHLQYNDNLTSLTCNDNGLLECLNISNGNQSLMTSLSVINNPNLTCVEVDNEIWALMEGWADYVDSQITFSEDCDNPCSTSNAGLGVLNTTPKTLVQILDLMGRETSFKPNTTLIYVYDDGSIEKVFSVE